MGTVGFDSATDPTLQRPSVCHPASVSPPTLFGVKYVHYSQIVRMLNDVNFAKKKQGEGDEGGVHGVDLCPASLEKEIDAMNDFVYDKVSHGRVHSSGGSDEMRLRVTRLRGRAKRSN